MNQISSSNPDGLTPLTDVPGVGDATEMRAQLEMILHAVVSLIERYVALSSEDDAVVLACFAMHTHLLDRFDCTPRLVILSPEVGSGKTRLLEVLAALVHDGRLIMSGSASSMFREVDAAATRNQLPPTLLFDEADTYMGTRPGQGDEGLRALIDGGYRRGSTVTRSVRHKDDFQPKSFQVFAPVALASLKSLAPSIMSRAVVIQMLRRPKGHVLEHLREREKNAKFPPLVELMRRWAADFHELVDVAATEMPQEVTDRLADVWEDLICIGDIAGGEIAMRVRRAAVAAAADRGTAASLGIQLLADLRVVLRDRDSMFTQDILEALLESEDSRWRDVGGQRLDPRMLAKFVRPFGVKPDTVWIDGHSQKGYKRVWFEDIWSRYLSDEPIDSTSAANARSINPSAGASVPTETNVRAVSPSGDDFVLTKVDTNENGGDPPSPRPHKFGTRLRDLPENRERERHARSE